MRRDAPFRPAAPQSAYGEVNLLYPESKQLTREESPFDAPYVIRRQSMLIEPANLPARAHAGFSDRGRQDCGFANSLQRANSCPCEEDLLFNCTGLGARTLFHDEELIRFEASLRFCCRNRKSTT